MQGTRLLPVVAVVGALWVVSSCGTETASTPNTPEFVAAAQQYRQIANEWATGLPPEGSQPTVDALVNKFLLLASNENRFRIAFEKISFPANIQADATAMHSASQLLAGDDLDAMAALSPRHTQAEFDAAVKRWSTDWDARMAADKVLKKDLGIS